MAEMLPDFYVKAVKETIDLSDGTMLEVTRPSGIDGATWEETKQYYEAHPEDARRSEEAAKDAKTTRDTMQMNYLWDYYSSKLAVADELTSSSFTDLENNPDLTHIFQDIKSGGAQAAMQYYYNEPLMLKINRLMGGIPEDVYPAMRQIHRSPMTIQEAAKMGDEKVVSAYISCGGDVEAKDSKGVTSLGYAIGANRTQVVKLLLAARADLAVCDSNGSSGLHYAAAYGRKELLELLARTLDINKKNAQGQTPLALAMRNQQTNVADFLRARGATA